jgi:hypothetical protein
MDRHCVQYHSRTLATLAGRKEQQSLPLHAWGFNFPNFDVKIALSDSVKQTTEINLHTGLGIIVDLKANSVEEAAETSKNFAETILNLVSFSTLASCDSARLVSLIDIVDREPYPFRHYVYPFDDQEIIGSLRIVDEALFGIIFEAYDKSSDQQRIVRALSWLRKGIGEENRVNEFISYWVGLEVTKPILRRNLARRIRNPREWAGVEDIFTNRLRFQDFDNIKQNARNGLLHGFRELDDSFIKEIESYVDLIRKTLIYCIGSILGLEDSITLKIANKGPRRVRRGSWTVIRGDLRGLPRNFDELVRNYPRIDAGLANKKFSMDQRGNLSMAFTVSHHFHGSSDTKWELKARELWGDKDSGISHIDVK